MTSYSEALNGFSFGGKDGNAALTAYLQSKGLPPTGDNMNRLMRAIVSGDLSSVGSGSNDAVPSADEESTEPAASNNVSTARKAPPIPGNKPTASASVPPEFTPEMGLDIANTARGGANASSIADMVRGMLSGNVTTGGDNPEGNGSVPSVLPMAAAGAGAMGMAKGMPNNPALPTFVPYGEFTDSMDLTGPKNALLYPPGNPGPNMPGPSQLGASGTPGLGNESRMLLGSPVPPYVPGAPQLTAPSTPMNMPGPAPQRALPSPIIQMPGPVNTPEMITGNPMNSPATTIMDMYAPRGNGPLGYGYNLPTKMGMANVPASGGQDIGAMRKAILKLLGIVGKRGG